MSQSSHLLGESKSLQRCLAVAHIALRDRTLLSYRWMLGRGWRQDFEPPIARLRKQEPITLGYPCYSRHPWSVSGLRIISGRSRYRVNQFNLRAHFLDFGILR